MGACWQEAAPQTRVGAAGQPASGGRHGQQPARVREPAGLHDTQTRDAKPRRTGSAAAAIATLHARRAPPRNRRARPAPSMRPHAAAGARTFPARAPDGGARTLPAPARLRLAPRAPARDPHASIARRDRAPDVRRGGRGRAGAAAHAASRANLHIRPFFRRGGPAPRRQRCVAHTPRRARVYKSVAHAGDERPLRAPDDSPRARCSIPAPSSWCTAHSTSPWWGLSPRSSSCASCTSGARR